MNYYPNFNQFYGQPVQPIQPVQQMPKIPNMEQQYPQYTQPQQIYKSNIGLQGKSVDSIEVVKAMDIPLDGSISYFPIADGTAIVTKQLQQDGSSKTIVYKPIHEKEKEEKNEVPVYVTKEEFNESMKKMNNVGLKDEINNIKTQMKELSQEIREINDDIRKKKGLIK